MTPQSQIPAYGAGGAPDVTYRCHGLLQQELPLTVSDSRIGGLEAVRQAVILILSTERCRYQIFSWDYGIELEDLYGRPASFIRPELERRAREALTQDDRITGVDGFTFESNAKGLRCTFFVRTIFGDLEGMRIENIRSDN